MPCGTNRVAGPVMSAALERGLARTITSLHRARQADPWRNNSAMIGSLSAVDRLLQTDEQLEAL